MSSPEEFESKAKFYFQKGDYEHALKFFNEAIKADKNNPLHYSNRSSCYLKMMNYEKALQDAETCLSIKHDYVEGYLRKGRALQFLDKFDECINCLSKGLELDSKNKKLMESLIEAKKERARRDNPLIKNYYKLYNHELTSDYMKDSHFEKLVKEALEDSNLLEKLLDNDIRFRDIFSVLTGLDKKKISDEMENHKHQKQDFIEKMEKEAKTLQRKNSEEKKKMEEEQEILKMSPEEKLIFHNQKYSEELKFRGNEEQKKKNYDSAIKYFEEALNLNPKDLNLNLNLASVYLEIEDFERCIKECEYVLNNTSDKIQRSRSYGKIGIAYYEKCDFIQSIQNLKLSINEHKDDRIVEQLIEIEKQFKKYNDQKYINPEIAINNNEKANQLYNDGKIEDALEQYTEAIKRDPDNPKYYCNRSEAFLKVLSFNEAIKDCDKAIELDNHILRAYLTKIKSHMMLKQYDIALETIEYGFNFIPDDLELNELKKKIFDMMSFDIEKIDSEIKKSAPDDIKNLLYDPRVKNLIDTLKSNPSFAHEFMKSDKFLKETFSKLMKYGLISDSK